MSVLAIASGIHNTWLSRFLCVTLVIVFPAVGSASFESNCLGSPRVADALAWDYFVHGVGLTISHGKFGWLHFLFLLSWRFLSPIRDISEAVEKRISSRNIMSATGIQVRIAFAE
jgi:hypothetical protein